MESQSNESQRSERPRRRRSFGLAEGVLAASALLLGAAILEGALRLLTPFPIHTDDANRDPHEALGYVVSPAFSDIDSHGFRNSGELSLRDQIDLVTLGDSHTFGQNVPSEQSWPQQLGRIAHLSVYNSGVGGYGILQYAYLFERALTRNPKHVVVGLYLATDFARFCEFARMPYWRDALARRGIATPECDPEGELSGASNWRGELRDWPKSTALGSALIYHVWYPLEARLSALGMDTSALEIRYAGGSRQTLCSEARVEVGPRLLDLSDPRTAAADRAARALFEDMAESAQREGVKLSVLLIPSKENVILDSLPSSDPQLERVRQLVASERALIERYQRFFDSIGVQTVTGRAALAAKLDSTRVYSESADSHPLATGYLTYAEAALPLVTQPR
jgi:hypothetical protein